MVCSSELYVVEVIPLENTFPNPEHNNIIPFNIRWTFGEKNSRNPVGIFERYSDAENLLKILKNSHSYLMKRVNIHLICITNIEKYFDEICTPYIDSSLYVNNAHINKFYPESMYNIYSPNDLINTNDIETFIHG